MMSQMCQLIIILYIATSAAGNRLETNRRIKNRLVSTLNHSSKGLQSAKPHDTPANPKHVKLEATGRNPEENRVPKGSFLSRDHHGAKGVQNKGVLGIFPHRGSKKNTFPPQQRKTELPEEQHAKIFWNYFVYKMNAAPEEFGYPVKVKTQEIQREVCKTLPFSQNIMHENCEKVVIQNNLCFGKCNSLHVPNQKEQPNICSHCQPYKFTINHLKLNCTGASNVVKAVMMVEECRCMVHRHNILEALIPKH